MHGFERAAGRYVARLDPGEREVLATVVADVAELLGAGRFGIDPRPTDPARGAGSNPLLGLRMSPVAVPAPIDPAVHRLLPDASDDDPELAAEFRRLTEDDLRSLKVNRLRTMWRSLVATADAGEPAELAELVDAGESVDLVVRPEDAAQFAATLTDLRLVLAERLGVESEEDSDALYDALEGRDVGPDDPDRTGRELLADEIRDYLGSVYAALSWLQESLLAVMLADLP
jgi:hypothetical protein